MDGYYIIYIYNRKITLHRSDVHSKEKLKISCKYIDSISEGCPAVTIKGGQTKA